MILLLKFYLATLFSFFLGKKITRKTARNGFKVDELSTTILTCHDTLKTQNSLRSDSWVFFTGVLTFQSALQGLRQEPSGDALMKVKATALIPAVTR